MPIFTRPSAFGARLPSLVILFFLIFSAGCASVGTTGAKQVEVKRSATYAADYEAVWNDAVAWFARDNIPIARMDKDSGLIASPQGMRGNPTVLDCGKATGRIGLYSAEMGPMDTSVNVLIRRTPDGTQATMNVFGNVYVSLHNGYGLVGESTGECYSTGAMERSFHQYLSSRITAAR